MRFPIDVIMVCIRWYAAYPLSYRHLEEMMEERGVSVDHSSINRWAIRFLPLIKKMARKSKRSVGGSWRMDETYIEVKGIWKYLYRAVDKQGKTVDFLLTTKRDMAAAKRFFDKAMGTNGDPEKVALDKSGANKAAIDAINAGRNVPILVRQVNYLNNIVEQDHRAIKRLTRPMLNFKSFQSAGSVLAGIELVHMIRKGQFAFNGADAISFADQFSALAGIVPPVCAVHCRSGEIPSFDQQRDRTHFRASAVGRGDEATNMPAWLDKGREAGAEATGIAGTRVRKV
jgi:putative transposase